MGKKVTFSELTAEFIKPEFQVEYLEKQFADVTAQSQLRDIV